MSLQAATAMVTPTTTLTVDDLIAVAKRAVNGRQDPFTDHPSVVYARRPFLISQKLSGFDSDERPGDGTWSYDRDSQALTFIIPAIGADITVHSSSRRTGQYMGRNSFGVTTKVTENDDLKVILDQPGPNTPATPYKVTVSAEPDVAKRLARDAVVNFEGTLIAEGGTVTNCEKRTTDATIATPHRTTKTTCVLNASITRIQVIASGVVLASFTPQAPVGSTSRTAVTADFAPLRSPSPADFARYYPDLALRNEASGEVLMNCEIDPEGRLQACAVISESPPKLGFGEAALKLSRVYRMQPAVVNGQPITGRVALVPVRFSPPK